MKSISLLTFICIIVGYLLVSDKIGVSGFLGLFLLQWAHNLERHSS